jgi:hypothetical protein
METQQGGKPQKKWYKKIKYWILITLGVFIGIIVLALVSSKGMPILKDVPKEVKQADLEINGWGVEANSMVKAYLNENLISETSADENGKFKFSVSLSEGINTVYAEATYKGEVEKSSQKKITYSPEIKVAESEVIPEQKEPEQVAPVEKQQPAQQETTETTEQPKEKIENKQEENSNQEKPIEKIESIVKNVSDKLSVTIWDSKQNFAKESTPPPYEVNVIAGNGDIASCYYAKNVAFEIMKKLYSDAMVKGNISRVIFTSWGHLRVSVGAEDGIKTDWSISGPTNFWTVMMKYKPYEDESGALSQRTWGKYIGDDCK